MQDSRFDGRYFYVWDNNVTCYRYYLKSKDESGTNWSYTFSVYKKTAKKNISYSKGTTQYSDVTSTSSSTYPSNGASGSYWYVYKGVN